MKHANIGYQSLQFGALHGKYAAQYGYYLQVLVRDGNYAALNAK